MNAHLQGQLPHTSLLDGFGWEFNPQPYAAKQAIIDSMAEEAMLQMQKCGDGTMFTMPSFDADSKVLSDIKAGATSWRALEIIYNFDPEGTDDQLAHFWIGMRNAQAVRNRSRMAKVLLKDCLMRRATETSKGTRANPLQMLSLACGSAQVVIEALAELRDNHDLYTQVMLIDYDPEAEDYIKRYAHEMGLDTSVHFVCANVMQFLGRVGGKEFDVVEMMGFLDYLEHKYAVWLSKKIHDALEPGGLYLTCHIHPNPEQDFLRYVINWGNKPYMFYRSTDELSDIVVKGGFPRHQIYTEPHKIHSIAIGRKYVG